MIDRKKILIKILFFLFCYLDFSSAQEMRGTWIARSSLSSKDALAQAMDTIAANNFNTVFVNAWSRGYPLWNSEVFFNETGIRIDPQFNGRDIIAEAIAEGHKHGLHVEVWFEYGFVGGYTSTVSSYKGPIFQNHPDWLARKNNGSDIDTISDGSGFFYWMIHTKPEVQNFLIALTTELCRKYDIDGIELDRIRYPGLQWGYDNFTDSLYRAEHNNNPPPVNISDASWIRWRADKLNDFIARAYDSIKTINQFVNISNAPSLYSSNSYTSYNSYCQDWVWWINNNKVDNVQVQSYVSSTASFSNILDYIGTLVNNKSKVFPAFATKPNGVFINVDTAPTYVTATRSKGFNGNAIWYYNDLLGSFFAKLKSSVYSNKSHVPYSSVNWRSYFKIDQITDSLNLVFSGNWMNSSFPGFNGPAKYTTSGSNSTIDYYFNVPANGTYEIYTFNVTSVNGTDSAKFIITDSTNVQTIKYLNQNNSINKRWIKLGDFKLAEGRSKVVQINSENIQSGQILNADAMMIILNRKLSPGSISDIETKKMLIDKKKSLNFNLSSYPNPFNSLVQINYDINEKEPYSIKVIDLLGREIQNYFFSTISVGKNKINLTFENLPSGIYFLVLIQKNKIEKIKLVLLK